MFLSYAIHFRKILVKSQPQRSYKKKVLIKKCILWTYYLLGASETGARVTGNPERSR